MCHGYTQTMVNSPPRSSGCQRSVLTIGGMSGNWDSGNEMGRFDLMTILKETDD